MSRNGHKTGFYLDQRDNRCSSSAQLAAGRDVLNCFCYTGGFTVHALAARRGIGDLGRLLRGRTAARAANMCA